MVSVAVIFEADAHFDGKSAFDGLSQAAEYGVDFAGSKRGRRRRFFYTLGAGQPMLRSIPATGSECFWILATVRRRSSRLSPMSWAKTGRPVLCSRMESTICASSVEWAWTRKYSVKSRSGGP